MKLYPTTGSTTSSSAWLQGLRIKEYFANYFACRTSRSTCATTRRRCAGISEPWSVTLVNTGEHDDRRRLKRVQSHVGGEPFCFTYGDGLSNVDVRALVAFPPGARRRGDSRRCSRPGASASSTSAREIRAFQRSPPAMDAHQRLGFSCSSPRSSTTEGDATVFERPARVSGRRAAVGVFARRLLGTRWTRCATDGARRSVSRAGRPEGGS